MPQLRRFAPSSLVISIVLSIVLGLALCVALRAAPASAALSHSDGTQAPKTPTQRTLRVGVYDFAPMVFSENGQAKGFFVDLLADLAQREKWRLVFVPGTWAECLSRLESGEIDLLPSIARTPERDTLFRFTEDFLFLDWGVIYKKRGSAIRTVFDLKGKTITALSGSVYTEKLRTLLEQFGIQANIVTKPDYAEALAAVGRGEADAGVCTNVLGTILDRNLAIARTDIVFAPIKLRMAVKRGGREDLLPVLDRRLEELKAQPDSLYHQSRDKWLGLAAASALPRWLPWALGGGLLVLCVLTAFVVSLRLLVQRRTEALRKSEKHYLTTLTAVNDGLWDWHVPTGEAYFSPLYYGLLGYADQEFPASYATWLPLVHPEDIDRVERELKRSIETGQGFSIDLRMRTRGGGWKWVCTRGKAIERDAGGRAVRMVGTLSDVTYRKGLESRLRESELHFRTLADSGQALIWTATPDKLCNYFNEPWLAFTGRALEQELGSGWTEGVHPDDFQRCLDLFTTSFDRRENFSMEYRLRHHSGEYRWIVDKGTPRYDSDGAFLGYIGHCLDISENKRAEDELLAKTEYLDAMFNNTSTLMLLVNAEGNVVDVNLAAVAKVGQPQETLQGHLGGEVLRCVNSFLGGGCGRTEDCQICPVRTRVMRTFSTGERSFNEEGSLTVSVDGKPVRAHFLISTALIRHRNGDFVLVSLIDITGRRQAEEALWRNQEFTRIVMENLPIGLAVNSVDPSVAFEYMNDNFPSLYRTTREKLALPDGFWAAAYEDADMREQMRARVLADCASGDAQRMYWADVPITRRGEPTTYITARNIPLPEHGLLISTVWDVTHRKLGEEALKESNERLQTSLRTAMDGYWRADLQGRLREVNEAYCRMSGYSAQELLTLSIPDLEARESGEAVRARIETLKSSNRDRFETKHRRKDGSLYDVEVSVTFQESEGGWLVAFLRDITERKRAEADLVAAKNAAEAANRAKSEFLANMSHELRTPMNGVLGMLQLLMLEEELKPSQQDFASNAFVAANRLLSLLNDILDFSRIEAGVLVFKQEPFQPGDILDATLGVFGHACARKGLALNILPEPGLPAWLRGDEARIRQVVFNLVGNAVKFTRQGAITVEVWHRTLPGAAQGRLIMAVSDTGVGIPEAKLDAVFDRFSQADGSYARQFEGAGLGLAIVRRIVECLGGSLCIESEVGQGTTAVLSLSAPVERGAAVAAQAETGLADVAEEVPLRILLAEDELIGQLGARLMLERMGHSVVAVNDGIDAVAAALKQEFDCVLMDIQMPEMDGLEATRILRTTTLPGQGGRLPIIAMTAYALAGDREKFLAAGMDEYIAKPFRQDELRALLQTVAQRRRRGDL